MKIVIDTETREVREFWSDADKEKPYNDVQSEKIEGIAKALACQMVYNFPEKERRDAVMEWIFEDLVMRMDRAQVGSPKN